MFNRFPHRTYCDTLEEMRQITKKLSPWNVGVSRAILSSLIEECQTYGNRMEASLDYQRDIEKLHEKRKALNEEISELKKALDKKEEKTLAERLDDLDD